MRPNGGRRVSLALLLAVSCGGSSERVTGSGVSREKAPTEPLRAEEANTGGLQTTSSTNPFGGQRWTVCGPHKPIGRNGTQDTVEHIVSIACAQEASEVVANSDGRVTLSAPRSSTEYVVTGELFFPAASSRTLGIAANDSFSLWINGVPVADGQRAVSESPQTLFRDDAVASVNFKEGKNTIVMRLRSAPSPWNSVAGFRVHDCESADCLSDFRPSSLFSLISSSRQQNGSAQTPALSSVAAAWIRALRSNKQNSLIPSGRGNLAANGESNLAAAGKPDVTVSADGSTAVVFLGSGMGPEWRQRIMRLRFADAYRRVDSNSIPFPLATTDQLLRASLASFNEPFELNSPGYEADRAWAAAAIIEASRNSKVSTIPDSISVGGMVSSVDRAVEPYLLYTPPEQVREDHRFPLVLLIGRQGKEDARRDPATFVRRQLDYFARHAVQARRFGFGLLMARGRERPGSLIAIRETLETLAVVRKRLQIKNDIFVYGGARGGTEAMMMPARYPEIFRGSAAFDPTLDICAACDSPAKSKHSRAWLFANSPVALKIFKPCLVMHDRGSDAAYLKAAEEIVARSSEMKLMEMGANGTQDPVEEAYRFFAQLAKSPKEEGESAQAVSTTQLKFGATSAIVVQSLSKPLQAATVSVVFGKKDTPSVVSVVGAEQALLRLPEARRQGGFTLADSSRSYVTTAEGQDLVLRLPSVTPRLQPTLGIVKTPKLEGPVADAFAGSFAIVVAGDGEREKRAGTAAARAFSARWAKNFFAEPKLASNTDLESDTNLLIFGCHSDSPLLSKLLRAIAVSCSREGIVLAGKKFEVARWGLVAAVPDPFGRSRYVVLVAASMPEDLGRATDDFALNGYFDYRITSFSDDSVVEVGYFDNSWSRLMPIFSVLRSEKTN